MRLPPAAWRRRRGELVLLAALLPLLLADEGAPPAAHAQDVILAETDVAATAGSPDAVAAPAPEESVLVLVEEVGDNDNGNNDEANAPIQECPLYDSAMRTSYYKSFLSSFGNATQDEVRSLVARIRDWANTEGRNPARMGHAGVP